MTQVDLTGQVALVTGAASGIGRATAIMFARAGVRVAMVDKNEPGLRQTADEIQKAGGACKSFTYDLVSWQGIPALVDTILAELRQINILVNCAGITDMGRHIFDVDDALWDEVFAVNLRSPFVLMQNVGRHMAARGGGGKIVNISSSSGFRAAGAPPVYSTTKTAIYQLTRSAASDLAQYDINVNAIAPGVTDTPMMAAYPRNLAAEGTLANLFKRWATADDVANTVLFLCSPQSRQITGQVIHTSAGAIV